MAAWVLLGEEISRADFPGSEVFQCLSPFDVDGVMHRRCDQKVEQAKVPLERLYQVLKLNVCLLYTSPSPRDSTSS
eukprot:9481498-Prorocentrum_lima.AAC.1